MLSFEVSGHPPHVPEEGARIYRLAPPRVSRKGVLTLARQFGLTASPKTGTVCQDARHTSYSEGSFKLVVHHGSGGLRFFDDARWQVDDGTSNVDFDDATAIGMAERFIEAHSVVPLRECKVLRVTRLNVGVAERSTGLAEHRVVDVGVAFTRVVDGIQVEGPGGKVMVYIDAKGNLTGIDCLWRRVLDVHAERVRLRRVEEVQKEAVREWGTDVKGRVTIDDVRFGYFEQGWDVSQRYLQPVYTVSMTITATEGDLAGRALVQSGYWATAAVTPPERLVPGPQRPRPQTPRRPYSGRPAE
jgi:hypothetical protein